MLEQSWRVFSVVRRTSQQHGTNLLVLQLLDWVWSEEEVNILIRRLSAHQVSLFRALSETVSSSEKAATMSWLGMFPAGNKQSQDGNTINIPIPQTNTRVRRVSCKGIETAMAGGLGKVWYDS